MKIRTLWFGASTLLLLGAALAAPAVAQTMYDDEKRPIYIDREQQQRDIDATRRDVQRRDITTDEARAAAQRANAPPRVYKMDVAQVDRRYDRAFRQTVNSRKMGATDWQELRRQRSEIDQLKDRIRDGYQVTPSQVDRALGFYDQSRPGY